MHRLIALLVCTALLAGCPTGRDGGGSPPKPAEPDEFDSFAALQSNETFFHDELKRLQGLFTEPASISSARPGKFAGEYALSTREDDGSLALVLTDGAGKETLLWFWHAKGAEEEGYTVYKDEAVSEGYLYEAALDRVLTLTLRTRWVQGRFLQVSRELMLGGLDMEMLLEERQVTFSLDGGWLPYRLLPAATGEYGVVPDELADGGWHGLAYPSQAFTPAVAAYDAYGGWLLAVVDDHPRKADREYELQWCVNPAYAPGGLCRIIQREYNGITDTYEPAFLPSGLSLRDSIVLEPLEFTQYDGSVMRAEECTRQAIRLLSELQRAFHYRPAPPKLPAAGHAVVFEQWGDDTDGLPGKETLDLLIGQYGASYGKAQPGLLEVINGLEGQDMPNFTGMHLLVATDAVPTEVQLRDENALAVWLRGQAGLADGLAADGVWLPGSDYAAQAQDSAPAAPYAVSGNALQAGAQLYLASALGQVADGSLVQANAGELRLCQPASAALNVAAFPFEEKTGSGSMLVHGRRLANAAYTGLFGVAPVIANSQTNLAVQLLGFTGGQAGLLLDRQLEVHPGFAAVARSNDVLRTLDGGMTVVHSLPAQSAYALDGELPAHVSELVAILPGDMETVDTIWVVFYGVGGSVSVDHTNTLEISWQSAAGQQSYTGKLPLGYWEAAHPAPDNVQPGDAVPIQARPAIPGSLPGTTES